MNRAHVAVCRAFVALAATVTLALLVHTGALAGEVGTSDGSGGSIFVWADANGRLLAQRVSAAGERLWPAAGVLVTTGPVTAGPVKTSGTVWTAGAVAENGSGGVVVAWLDERSGQPRVYAQRIDASGTRLWEDTGVSVSPADAHISDVGLASDHSGGAFVAWTDARGSGSALFVQHLAADGTEAWNAGGVPVAASADQWTGPKLEPDGTGGVLVAWTSTSLAPRQARAQRLDASGSPSWAAGGVVLLTNAGVWDVVTDGAGGGIVVSVGDGATRFLAQRVTPDGGLPWGTAGVTLADFAPGSAGGQTPAVIPDGEGGAVASWFEGPNDDVLHALRLDGWGQVAWNTLSSTSTSAHETRATPRMVPDGTGGAVIAWGSITAGSMNVFAQRFAGDGTVQWLAGGQPVCTVPRFQAPLALVSDGAGGATIGWSDWRHTNAAGDLYAQRLDPSGATLWRSQGAPAFLARIGQRTPALASDGADGAVAAWVEVVDGIYEVRAQRLGANGEPAGPIRVVSDVDATNKNVMAVPDGSGGAIIAWVEQHSAEGLEVFLQRLEASDELRWTAGGVRVGEVTETSDVIAIHADGAGGAFAVIANGLVRAQHVDDAGMLQWGENGAVVSSAPQTSRSWGPYQPRVVPDGGGGVFVSWSDGRWYDNHCIRGCGYAVMAQRMDANGMALWATDGVVLRSRFQSKSMYGASQIAPDGTGGLFAVWESDFSSAGIYGQHLDADGASAWAADGVLLSLPNTAARARLAATATSQAIVVWEDSRSGAGSDLFAQHLSFPGPGLWSEGGLPLNVEPGDQTSPGVVADGAGGIVAVWTDSRIDPETDVYAQRLDAAGGPLWDAAGVEVSSGPGGQLVPVIASASDGGALFAWQDGRTGFEPKLGFQRLGPDGTPLWGRPPASVDPPVRAVLELARIRPNPATLEFEVRFALPDAGPASLELLDLAGRRVHRAEIGGGTAGERSVMLRPIGLAPGLYVVRLTHARGERTVKAVLMR